MIFIIATIVFILGLIIFTFTVSNIILILFFAIPFTKKLEKNSLLKSNNIVSSYLVALFIQVVILSVTTLIFYIYFLDSAFISLMVGYAFGLLGIITRINKFGLNMDNFSDYFEKNKEFFWEELTDLYSKDKDKILAFVIGISKKKNLKDIK